MIFCCAKPSQKTNAKICVMDLQNYSTQTKARRKIKAMIKIILAYGQIITNFCVTALQL